MATTIKGKVTSVNGNMITADFSGIIMQNEVAYIHRGQERLKAEVIKVANERVFLQVFESSKGIVIGDAVEFSGEMLSVKLGPGLLGQIYDGLQNPLPAIAEQYGVFLPRGINVQALDIQKKWKFTPLAGLDQKKLRKGDPLGYVQEGIFQHWIMVPFYYEDVYSVNFVASEGEYTINDKIAILSDSGGKKYECTMAFDWPIKIPISIYKDKYTPRQPLITRQRIVDTLFPIAKGGTFCVPGPFGAGKTVLQQLISRHAEADIVIISACGERAGEVVETLRKFSELHDPRTGKTLMERTIIICNTSSMPVAAREASVYTATTLGEYYRQMGLNVLLLADSTSRWAQAMREVSGRLEEIPGEEAYPAYLESRIAEFYERSGIVELYSGEKGSLTIGGTVSPAGGNFEEPVTQSTLKVVGAFLGLSRDRANARKFPSIDPLESWSRYDSFIDKEKVSAAKRILFQGNEVNQMMKVMGEEGTSLDDFVIYLKAEFLDSVYLQQNGFDKIDAATGQQRQEYFFSKVSEVLALPMVFAKKEDARAFFYQLRQLFIDWNYTAWESDEFANQEKKIVEFLRVVHDVPKQIAGEEKNNVPFSEDKGKEKIEKQ